MPIDHSDQNSSESQGNTEPDSLPAKKQGSLSAYWCFTLNNYAQSQIDHLEQVFRHECKWYVFQEETGAEGTPHLQGTLCLKDRQRLSSLKKLDPTIHWEATKSVKASLAYCTKVESRTGRQWVHGIEIPEELRLERPRGWQITVMDIIVTQPDVRTINWFWEPDGGVGKTSLCKYLVAKHDAVILSGKSNDMFHMLSKCRKRNLVIINVPRSTQDFVNYGAIEAIKDGLIFSGKYEGTMLVFNSPHVIVFANEPPYEEKMSADRWNIVRIRAD